MLATYISRRSKLNERTERIARQLPEYSSMSTGAFLIQLNPLTFKTKRASAPILTISTTLVSTQACFGGNLIVCLDAAKMARQNRAMLK